MDDFSEKDPLWNLLGRARKVEASPYLARKVLRAIREEPSRPVLGAFWRWFLPASACAALVLGWSAWQWRADESEFNETFDAVADLQSLVLYEDIAWVDTQ